MRNLKSWKVLVVGALVAAGVAVTTPAPAKADGWYDPCIDTYLYPNTSSRCASLAQSFLNYWGFFDMKPTGYYGPITVDAVRKFQKAWGLQVDGIVGPATWRALSNYRQPCWGCP